MTAKVRLMRIGKKKHPIYRIVVIDSHKPQITNYLEKLGNYDPNLVKNKITLDQKRLDYWKSKGAQLSKGLERLL